jgi:hypothetical protein
MAFFSSPFAPRGVTTRILSGACALLLAGAEPALAHTIVGDRLFPATLTIDDPGVNDELALPTFTTMTAGTPDGSPGAINYSLGWEYAKTITADLGVSVGSEGFNWARRPNGQGWSNIETQLKYIFWQDPKSEAIVSGALAVEWANTGSPQSASLAPDPYSTVTGKLFVGKGFGQATVDWLRPFAVTAEVDFSIPTASVNADGGNNPTMLSYGATLQYSLVYMNAFVHEVPDLLKRLIPAFEARFTSPISNIPAATDGDFSPNVTTGVVGPSLYYVGKYFQIGVMAQIPINSASGKGLDVVAGIDFYLDDIAPTTLGRPLFGAPQARGHY